MIELTKCRRNGCTSYKQHGDVLFCKYCRLDWRRYAILTGLEDKYYDGAFRVPESFVIKKLNKFIKEL